jgi:hypothetical protein
MFVIGSGALLGAIFGNSAGYAHGSFGTSLGFVILGTIGVVFVCGSCMECSRPPDGTTPSGRTHRNENRSAGRSNYYFYGSDGGGHGSGGGHCSDMGGHCSDMGGGHGH